jgi:hypothetical protein
MLQDKSAAFIIFQSLMIREAAAAVGKEVHKGGKRIITLSILCVFPFLYQDTGTACCSAPLEACSL